jgi:MATE family multidrug resistance protein
MIINASFKNEFVRLVMLTMPVIGTQFSQMAMGFVDTIMAGHASAADLAAVAVGSSIWVPLILLIGGILNAITPTIAHYFGAAELNRIGHVINQSVWIALTLAVFGFVTLFSMHDLFVLMRVDPQLLTIAVDYLKAIAWGMPAIVGFFILRYLNEGLANILPIMLVGLLGLLVNILCNYVLIFGHFGAPALGGVGAGWATSITHWFMMLALMVYCYKSSLIKKLHIVQARFRMDFKTIVKQLKLGLPIGIAFFVEGSIFSIIALFLASMGVVTVAAHQIALNLSSLIFIIPLSLSIALTIQVGHHHGAQQINRIRETVKAGYLISLTIASLAAGLIFLFAEEIAGLYSSNPEVIHLASSLMIFTALYQFSDGIQLCSAGSLRGLKDTRVTMIFSIISYWFIGFPLGYLLSLTDHITDAMGAKGFWIGLLAGLTFSAFLLTIRLFTRKELKSTA